MNKTLRNSLALLLCVVLALGALPFVSAGSDSTVLHSWTASTVEKDSKVFISNLVAGENVKVRWNETGVMYTNKGEQNVAVHNFLNEVGGRGNSTYALAQGTTLQADTYPVIKTAGMKAIDLSFLYVRKLDEKAANPANSGLMQVYVSKNGMDWLADAAAVRSADIVGTATVGGKDAIVYEVHCENLLNIDGLNAGDYIRGIRVMPDGETGTPVGTFALAGLTVTGYASKADFEAAVPAETVSAEQKYVPVNEEAIRKTLVDAAASSKAAGGLAMVIEAMSAITPIESDSVLGLLNADGLQLVGNVTDKAADNVKILFTYMFERYLMDPAEAEQRLADYETVETTEYIIREMNTPQTILQGYAASKAGDILLQVTEDAAQVYMVLDSKPVYMVDGVSVDPYQSTLTYRGTGSEKTVKYYDLYSTQSMVPMTLSVLANGMAPVPQVDAQATFADGVHVAVVSSLIIDQCKISVGGATVTMNPGTSALVCGDKALADAVAKLPDGKHQLTIAVTSGLSGEVVTNVEFEVEGGKAVGTGAAPVSHDDICLSKAMTDVDKNAWYHEAVDYALAGGIMSGYNATTFGPNDTLSRAMVVQVLYNKEGQPAISGKHDFTDVPADQWFNNAVTWGTQNGVMGGYGDGKFGPNDSVTIEQIAVILWNYSGNPAFSGKADSVGAYSSWAANALSWAVENDILEGVPFANATETATRAQTAQMLMNYLTAN